MRGEGPGLRWPTYDPGRGPPRRPGGNFARRQDPAAGAWPDRLEGQPSPRRTPPAPPALQRMERHEPRRDDPRRSRRSLATVAAHRASSLLAYYLGKVVVLTALAKFLAPRHRAVRRYRRQPADPGARQRKRPGVRPSPGCPNTSASSTRRRSARPLRCTPGGARMPTNGRRRTAAAGGGAWHTC